MIIAYGSDLHLEFGMDNLKQTIEDTDADVLVLAGDISTSRNWEKVNNSNSPTGKEMKQFLQLISENFEHTIMVMGNHDHYKGTYQKTSGYITEALPSNIHLLNNSHIEIDGVVFAGSTMWTEMSNNPVVRNMIHQSMNDFRAIRYLRGGDYAKFTPTLAHQEFIRAKSWMINLPTNKPIVMVTHHSPHSKSIPIQYQTSKLNDAYFSREIEYMLESGTLGIKPKLWIHGHIHNNIGYRVDETMVVCNARGYQGHESSADNFKFELYTI